MSGELDHHAVVGRFDALRQVAGKGRVIEFARHVRQDRALRLQAFNPGQRLLDAEMALVPRVAQRIDDPNVKTFEQRNRLGRDIADVGRVREVRHAIAERGDGSVPLREWAAP